MDANKTRYHLILGERDWLPLLLEQTLVDAWWDRSRQMISLAPVVKQLDELSRGELLDTSRRRGASYDHYGNIFWINDTENAVCYQPAATPGEIGVYWQADQLHRSSGTAQRQGDFGPSEDARVEPAPPRLRGLTVTAHAYLVVGTLNPGGLLAFDLQGGGPPAWLIWPEAVGLQPYDLCSAPEGGLWVLDTDFTTFEARVWHLDREFRILQCSAEQVTLPTALSHDFHDETAAAEPVESGGGRRFVSGLPLNAASPLLAERPVAIEAIASNSFIVLDSPPGAAASSIHYFVDGERVDSLSLDASVTGKLLGRAEIVGHDFAFVPGGMETSGGAAATARHAVFGDLYVSATHAQQSYRFSLRATGNSLRLRLQPRLIPMRAHGGKALVASGKNAYYDYEDRWLPLAEQPLHNYRNQARIEGIVKDGEQPDCVWHRIIIDACIPAGTSVRFETRTANHEAELGNAPWQSEPPPQLRSEGSEIPFHEPFDDRWLATGNAGSWDLLLQNAVGRFIELRIILQGNRRSTPHIRSCRIYYPRFSYLDRYLPDVYRQDRESAAFLDRFLANVEGLYTALEDKIARAESLFDDRTSPAEFLEWLGGWLGAFIDPSWDEARKRLFIANAFLLFKWRGTAIGLRALLRLSIDSCPDDSIFDPLRSGGIDCIDGCSTSTQRHIGGDIRIVEQFLTRRDPGIAVAALQDTRVSLELAGSDARWSPQQGAGPIHQRYQSFLASTYGDSIAEVNKQWAREYLRFDEIRFPALMPTADPEKRDWQHFTRDFLGFSYADVTDEDLPKYREFLQRRYRQISQLNTAHGLLGSTQLKSFDAVLMPQGLPVNQRALTDWIEFASIALPIDRQAHSFTVLLPTRPGDLPGELELRRARVEAIVEREKPAHTRFEVQFFWAMFQVGSARLGIDTLVGDSSRFVALALGANFLGESYLSESHPWSVVDRGIVGTERLAGSHEWRL
ncbi:MAG: hypothetical protein N838_07185 [Thiohalocapsa sp. PB-PSB1]|jgi:phage tail-like protein|nr:MAG: hypothetical protein N838_01630 [Thiohalocapsa sp. PB-PSB1]QQO53176.1 MAG: hypothetical protein N838_07185 [Thiohalocapsa sp. PB-PSB1]HCS91257.1 hypothetical protein [Chromatiaceae bacterium]